MSPMLFNGSIGVSREGESERKRDCACVCVSVSPDQTFNRCTTCSRSVLDILSCVRSVTLGNTVISPHLNSLKQDKFLNSKFT